MHVAGTNRRHALGAPRCARFEIGFDAGPEGRNVERREEGLAVAGGYARHRADLAGVGERLKLAERERAVRPVLREYVPDRGIKVGEVERAGPLGPGRLSRQDTVDAGAGAHGYSAASAPRR